jgi:hypothetical protein
MPQHRGSAYPTTTPKTTTPIFFFLRWLSSSKKAATRVLTYPAAPPAATRPCNRFTPIKPDSASHRYTGRFASALICLSRLCTPVMRAPHVALLRPWKFLRPPSPAYHAAANSRLTLCYVLGRAGSAPSTREQANSKFFIMGLMQQLA